MAKFNGTVLPVEWGAKSKTAKHWVRSIDSIVRRKGINVRQFGSGPWSGLQTSFNHSPPLASEFSIMFE
jgi:hypothetical protein